MLKIHHGLSVESLLPHNVVELILERLSVRTLLRFRCVSKTWKTTTDSQTFQKQQLIRRRRQSGDADNVLFVCILDYSDYEARRMRIMLGSQVIFTIMLPFTIIEVCHGSCDGLLCLADFFAPNFVINPVPGWHHSFPYSIFQKLVTEWYNKGDYRISGPKIGFGKDKLRGTYKPVWLYNSSQFGLDNVTTCEVFDFGTNTWRYVLPASPYRISGYHFILYLDGSLYWFTECEEETKVLSSCLQTETFQIFSKTPFAHLLGKPSDFIISVLDNRLCVSKYAWPNQVIWLLLLDDSSSSGTCAKFCYIDLIRTFDWFGGLHRALEPVAILDKNKLLLHGFGYMIPMGALVIYDLHTKSLSLLYTPTTLRQCVCYFPSLLTALLY
ncbi:hypothetical protein Bca52824_033224 [Brassica carinata]|uniref:F-box domain-containing protein n=1 Tax=Brassica carinata TaxID=52824 RepID=A0A8X7SE34_BRACI|nr:hypothetical protein Bca52824_033224 [Brassica carinata]